MDAPNPPSSKIDVDDIAEVSTVTTTPSADNRCPICWNEITHKIKLPCSHEFCFLCAKGAVLRSNRCPMCRGDVPVTFFDNCTINSENVNIATFEGNYHWYYEGRNGWWLFDARVSQEIEEQYQKRLTAMTAAATAAANDTSTTTISSGQDSNSVIDIDEDEDDEESDSDKDDDDAADAATSIHKCEVVIAGFMYTIDFTNMIQFRRDSPSRMRRIKRDQAETNTKGIAGLRGNINFI